jgi:hypothetical protein
VQQAGHDSPKKVTFNKLSPLTLLVFLIAAVIWAAWQSSGDNFYRNKSSEEKFGVMYNETRIKLGIKPLPSEWYTKETSGIPRSGYFKSRVWALPNYWSSQIWSDFSDSKKEGAYHKEKEISRFVKEIDSEIDRFVKIENDSVEYMIEVKYSYLYKRDSAWSASMIKTIDTIDDYIVESVDISFAEADSILASWNIPYLENRTAGR